MEGNPEARATLQALAMLRELPPRCRQEAVVDASGDPRRHLPRVFAGQCPLAGCEERVSVRFSDGERSLRLVPRQRW